MTAPTYRWSTSDAAESYDRAAEFVHPRYLDVQDQILAYLPFADNDSFVLVDLGAGSGRLAERVLQQYPNVRAVLVDQSEPFLGIAERRLHLYRDRVTFIQQRLQDAWVDELPAAPNAIVSTSAIHHLEPAEKQTIYARCYEALAPNGIFINGDEFRPKTDEDFLADLTWWAEHMQQGLKSGQIPESFQPVFEAWYDRNIRRFGEPKKSGDDCQETIAAQKEYLSQAGFANIETVWADRLWAVVVAV